VGREQLRVITESIAVVVKGERLRWLAEIRRTGGVARPGGDIDESTELISAVCRLANQILTLLAARIDP
jgi:hypothetical protein